MKVLMTIAVAAGFFALAAFAEIIRFDGAKIGELPPDWLAGTTGPGTCTWAVEMDAFTPGHPKALEQSAEVPSHSYPWCVKKGVSIKDGHVQVRFKSMMGKEDQAAGIIWRWQDGENYYVTRANALEDNVTVYHIIKGTRMECGRANIKVTSGEWHNLRVDFQGTHCFVTFDGAKVLEWEDDTFKDAGSVGVWTKADSVTAFNDFEFAAK